MSIIEFTPDQDFCQLYHTIFPEVTNKNGIFGQNAKWYGIKLEGGTIIAFCTIGIIDPHKIFVYNVGVNQPYREQGYGKQLMDYIIELYNMCDIYLFVKKNNHKAIRLYQKCHFGFAHRAFVPPMGEICMEHNHISS